MGGTKSIFVEAFQALRTFPARPKLNYYDQVEKFPREIIKKDKTVKFDKKYSGLFKKNYEVFDYILYPDSLIRESLYY